MQRAHARLDPTELRIRALQRIEETHVAGQNTRHSRGANIHAIEEMIKGLPNATLGVRDVQALTAQEALDAVADLTHCSRDITLTAGGGYISPNSTLKGLILASKAIYTAARQGKTFVVATGHPGSMLPYYTLLAQLIEQWGGKILVVKQGAFIPPYYELDYFGKVAVMTDRATIWHTHDTKPMEVILSAIDNLGLAVVDHGFAGVATNEGVPTISVMDTNDPAIAAAKRLGRDVIVVPMDDNRPMSSYPPMVDIIREYAEAQAWDEPAAGEE